MVGCFSNTSLQTGATMQDYRDLKVWQRAHKLVLQLYTITRSFPKEERYGLVSQMRRAMVSVAAN